MTPSPDEKPRRKKMVIIVEDCMECPRAIFIGNTEGCELLGVKPLPDDGIRPDCPLEDA